jgi:hypothetical protein
MPALLTNDIDASPLGHGVIYHTLHRIKVSDRGAVGDGGSAIIYNFLRHQLGS